MSESLFKTPEENHGSTILQGLFALYKHGKCADIKLKIGQEQTLRAHCTVLASLELLETP